MHSIKSRFVTRPSDILFACVYVCTFQPGHFTGCGSEGVNIVALPAVADGLFGLHGSELADELFMSSPSPSTLRQRVLTFTLSNHRLPIQQRRSLGIPRDERLSRGACQKAVSRFLHILQEKLLKVCNAISHKLRKSRFYKLSTLANNIPTLEFKNKNKKRSFL